MTASNPDVDLDASLMRARVAQLGSEVEVELLLNFGDVGMADWRTFGEPGSWTGTVDSGRLLTLADGAPAIPLYDYECGETTTTTSVGESVEAEGWTVSGTAERLGVSRVALSRVLNGRAGVSAALALALERIGWSDAEHWIRMQAIYDVAQERRKQAGVAA